MLISIIVLKFNIQYFNSLFQFNILFQCFNSTFNNLIMNLYVFDMMIMLGKLGRKVLESLTKDP